MLVLAAVAAAVAGLTPLHGQFDISAASYLGGSGGTDSVNGAVIQEDGTIVLAANLDNAHPPALANHVLGAGGNAAIVRLSADGRTILSVTRLADRVHDLSSDAEGNLYVAAGVFGLIKLNPEADAVIWTRLQGEQVWRVDAGTDGHSVALVPTWLDDNKPGLGTVHVFAVDGTPISSFAGTGNTLDVALDSRTQTVVYTGWYNIFVYNGPYSRGYNGGIDTPVDVPYTYGVPYDFGQPGVPRKWTLHGWNRNVWIDKEARIPNPRYINYPFSTDPSNLYTQEEIDALEAAEGRSTGYYQYLLGMPKEISNNMADTRSYRVSIGADGNLYIGSEADGGNTPLRFSGFDLTVAEHWTVGDGFFDAFFATSTVPKLVINAYTLQSQSVEWLRTFGFTNRLSTPRSDGSTDNTITMLGGALEADLYGRVYVTGQAYAGFYLPGNTSANFSIPRSGEIAFDPFGPGSYSGGSYLMVYSADFKTRMYSTRVAGGQGRALAVRLLDTEDSASFVWGGFTGPAPSQSVNRVHTVSAVQPTRLGADTDVDGWFAVVNGTPAALRALGHVAAVNDPASPVVLNGSRSFSRTGQITAWTWTDLADGRIVSRDEMATVEFPEGAYNLRLTVSDNLGASDSRDFSLVVTAGDPGLLPRFESNPPTQAIKDWIYQSTLVVSTGNGTLFTGVSGAPAGLVLSDNGDGTATLAGEPAESGVFRVTVTAQANGHTATLTWLLTVHDGGLGGSLLDDDFAINSTTAWSFARASTAAGQPTVRWLASGNSGYAATGVLNARGHHQADSSTQSIAYYQTFAYRENLSESTLSTTGIHRHSNGHPIVRALMGYDTGSGIQYAVSDQAIHTTSAGSSPIAPVAGSWQLADFTWKSVDIHDLNAGLGSVVPAATVLTHARAMGLAQIQLSGAWLADRFMQADSLTLVSHRDTLPNKPPVFASVPFTGAAVGDPYSLNVLINDPDGLGVTVTAPGLPTWLALNFNGAEYALAGTPGAADTGVHWVELVATNSAGAQAWQSFQIAVAGAQNPVFSNIPAAHVIMGAEYVGEVRAQSAHGDPRLLLSTNTLPDWLGFTDFGNGVGRFTGTAPAATGSYPIVLTASDGFRTTNHEFDLVVTNPAANQPPVAVILTGVSEGIRPLSVSLSAAASFDPDGSIVAYAWELGEGTYADTMVVPFTYTAPGRYTVRLTVTDDAGAIDTVTQDIIVRAPGSVGEPVISDNFATNTVANWNTRGIDALGRAITFSWAANGQNNYDTTALAAPGVIRTTNPHTGDTTTLTHLIWRSFAKTDLRDATAQSDGIHSALTPAQSGFIVEYEVAGTTHWAITSTSVTITTGASAVATAGDWNLNQFSWRELNWDSPESGSGAPVVAQTVLSHATGFGVYNRISGAWLRDRGLQVASLSLFEPPADFPQVTSLPPVETFATLEEFSILLTASDPSGYAITWSSADPLPAWLSLENLGDGMALLRGTPPLGTSEPLTLRLLASTTEAGPAWHTFALTFTDEHAPDPHPTHFSPQMTIEGNTVRFEWFGFSPLIYRLEHSPDLHSWQTVEGPFAGENAPISVELPVPATDRFFFRLSYER
ncbi:MAG: putative Ig domain-containing protein [Opitutales bacterium]|nr:putative Ig domain-containing protein [Opitutales bacterium]